MAKENNDNFRHFVRIKNTDLEGRKHVSVGLTKIKGVGVMFANMICSLAGIVKSKKLGVLEDSEIQKLEKAIDDTTKIPSWMLNRRNDVETGIDKHLFTSDLDFAQQNDRRRMQKNKSYRGLRLSWGLPVRGQRTSSNFRKKKGKTSLGVKRKK